VAGQMHIALRERDRNAMFGKALFNAETDFAGDLAAVVLQADVQPVIDAQLQRVVAEIFQQNQRQRHLEHAGMLETASRISRIAVSMGEP